jgi:hypothetical protein
VHGFWLHPIVAHQHRRVRAVAQAHDGEHGDAARVFLLAGEQLLRPLQSHTGPMQTRSESAGTRENE